MPQHKTLSPTLKPPEFTRDAMGRFERPGATLKKDQKSIKGRFQKGQAPGPGRPPGVQNKTTVALKEAILAACEAAGGEEGSVGYLRRLAIENSSAFAGLLGKVLPTTLAASESDGGAGVQLTFQRVIVWPDGHREIEGVTPKQLSAPASHTLRRNMLATQKIIASLVNSLCDEIIRYSRCFADRYTTVC